MAETTKTFPREGDKTQAVLVSLLLPGMTEEGVDVSQDELQNLLESAGGEAALRVVQSRESPHPKTFIGKGKAAEIGEFAKARPEVTLAVFDHELSPSQIKNLEDLLEIRVIDRTMLILDIFASRAVTSEGKLQVEIACLRYTAPRMVGHGKEMSRLGGGIGTRGPGESQLETDRRHLRRRIETLNARLLEMERSREIERRGREKSKMKTVAIAGYTNAGKSTLQNYLTKAGVLAEDRLFATLDPTTRKLTLPEGEDILLTDTVGFIDRLPTHLIKAFKSTLEEIKYADAILCLIDATEPDTERERKRKVTEKLLNELSGGGKDVIWCYNKWDKAVETQFIAAGAQRISAATGEGVDKLLLRVKEVLNAHKKTFRFYFPHNKAAEMHGLFNLAEIQSTEYTDGGARVCALCDQECANRYGAFIENA